ncbi:FAD binding domain containing protein [Planoprotostelium fungivorum]|uniref:FAD binding domain containing protein n=1 Tax=Planoprotostelium fungivorum TaxID=1890364 RepID=A0A2P6NE99_9EUKA|nr:FAD binding domain containing protein [Planoprotostelium fungivorum]
MNSGKRQRIYLNEGLRGATSGFAEPVGPSRLIHFINHTRQEALESIRTNTHIQDSRMSLSPIIPTRPVRHTEKEDIPSASHIALATQAKIRKDVIYNWSGIQSIAKRSQIHFPTTEKQVSQLVRFAPGKVHFIGSGLSYEQIMSLSLQDDNGILINMEHFKGLIKMTDTTATFGAATTVNDIISILGDHDKMLPVSPGVIGIQTIAGAISTGTHGQGMFQSSYSDMVESLRVVLPDGNIRHITKGDDKYPLDAFVTSVGTLCAILEVEIKTTPRRVFFCEKSACNFEEFIGAYSQWNQEHEYVKGWWFPETDQCHIWKVDEASAKQRDAFLATNRKAPLESTDNSDAMNSTVDKYMSAMSKDTKSHHTSDQKQFQTVKRFADARDLVAYQEQILCKGIPVPQINCEIAIPFERFADATRALHRWNSENPGRLHYPFIYRAVGPSTAWINAPSRGPTMWIGFLVYVAEDGTVRSDGMETMGEIQRVLGEYGGLPHWGKHYVKETYKFQEALPKFKEFVELRKKIDPQNKFLSQFMEKIVGGEKRMMAKL